MGDERRMNLSDEGRVVCVLLVRCGFVLAVHGVDLRKEDYCGHACGLDWVVPGLV